MSSYSIQFQRGLPLADFLARFGTEAQCIRELERQRWPGGFDCPHCLLHHEPYRVTHGRRTVLQCRQCRHQTSLMAGTMLDSTKLPLRTWFLAMFFLSQAKTGMSALRIGFSNALFPSGRHPEHGRTGAEHRGTPRPRRLEPVFGCGLRSVGRRSPSRPSRKSSFLGACCGLSLVTSQLRSVP